MSWPHKTIIWCFRLLLVLVPLVFLPNTSELFEFNKLIITYLFTILIVFFWLFRNIAENKLIFKKTLLDWPIILFLLSQFISLLFSIDNRTSWMGYYSRFNGGFLSLLCYSLLYWAAVTHLDSKSTKSIITYGLFTCALVSLYGILEHFGIDKTLWVQDVQTRVFSTLGQPNWLAAYISALIFIPLSKLLKFQETSSKKQSFSYLSLGYWLLVILLFVTLLFTKSRSGIAAFGISWLIFWIIQIKYFGFKILKNYLFLVSWLLVITFSLLIPTPFRDQLFSNLNLNKPAAPAETSAKVGTSLESGGTESGEIRKIVWQGAIDMWKSSPKTWWIGTGTETFAQGYYQHRPLAHNATSEWELLYNKAHNEYLNYLATTGILGLISYLVLLTFMFIILIKFQLPITKKQTNSNNQNSNPKQFVPCNLDLGNSNLILPALLAGWLTIPLTNFWGFSVTIINLLMFLLPAFAITLNKQPITTNYHKLPPMTKSQLWLILIFLGTPTLVLLYYVGKYWLADTHYAAGQKYLRMFSATQDTAYLYSAYQEDLSAFQFNDADPPIASDLSIVTAYLALLAKDQQPQTSSELENTAIAAGLRAIAISPYHPNYYKSLSRTYIVLSSFNNKYLDSADQILASAQEISPTDPRLPFNRGVIAQYKNNYATAQKFYTESLKLKPNFPDAKAALDAVATMSATPLVK